MIGREPATNLKSATIRAPRLGLQGGTDAPRSRAWFDRAKRVLAGGISSSARANSTGDLPYPLYLSHGRGARVWDVDGHEFVDFLLSYGSVILGHTEPAFVETLNAQLELGTMFGTCNTVEVELAEQICRMVPCAELVRYANSGSEAIQGAVRAARGATGREKILKFEGHYHGWVDVLAVSNRPSIADAGAIESPNSSPHSLGMTAGVVNDVIICPWNEPQILQQILNAHAHEIAAVIAEPIVANNACIMPAAGYLQLLREECSRRGIVLIYDEIVTGFRVAPGGAQELFGVEPDIAVFSKAIGGGLPISAFAGKHFVMDAIGKNTVKHGGTYNGNPLCAAAALHTLRELADPSAQARMRDIGERVIESMRRAARDHHVGCLVQGVGSMFQIMFTNDPTPPKHYRDLQRADAGRFAIFRQSMLEQGVLANNSGLACWFVSTAHTNDDAAIVVDAVDVAMRAVARS